MCFIRLIVNGLFSEENRLGDAMIQHFSPGHNESKQQPTFDFKKSTNLGSVNSIANSARYTIHSI